MTNKWPPAFFPEATVYDRFMRQIAAGALGNGQRLEFEPHLIGIPLTKAGECAAR